MICKHPYSPCNHNNANKWVAIVSRSRQIDNTDFPLFSSLCPSCNSFKLFEWFRTTHVANGHVMCGVCNTLEWLGGTIAAWSRHDYQKHFEARKRCPYLLNDPKTCRTVRSHFGSHLSQFRTERPDRDHFDSIKKLTVSYLKPLSTGFLLLN